MDQLPRRAKKKNLHRQGVWDDAKRFFDIYYQTEKNFTWINRYPFLKQIKPRDKNHLLDKAFNSIKTRFQFFNHVGSEVTKNNIIVNLQTQVETSGYEVIKISYGRKVKGIFSFLKTLSNSFISCIVITSCLKSSFAFAIKALIE